MLINKSNYELFALDYIEGNLEGANLQAMKAFLRSNPTIAAEVEALQADFVELTPNQTVVYDNKAALLRKDTAIYVPFYRRRVTQIAAAAAVVFLLIGFGAGYFMANQQVGQSGVVVQYVPIEPEQELTTDNQLATTDSEVESDVEQAKSTVPITVESERKTTIVPPTIVEEEEAIATNEVSEEEEMKETAINASTSEVVEMDEKKAKLETIVTAPIPNIPKPPMTTLPTTQEDTIDLMVDVERLAMNDNQQSLLDRVGRVRKFMGKLPFEEATLKAFVPSYFVNETE